MESDADMGPTDSDEDSSGADDHPLIRRMSLLTQQPRTQSENLVVSGSAGLTVFEIEDRGGADVYVNGSETPKEAKDGQ